MAVVSVSLPDTLLRQADDFADVRGYSGRSELVRAALRDFLAGEQQHEATGDRTATLTLLYPDGFERKIADVRHDFTDVVTSLMHGHAGDMCVELFMLQGPGERIRRFADTLRGARETRMVHVTYTDVHGDDDTVGHGH